MKNAEETPSNINMSAEKIEDKNQKSDSPKLKKKKSFMHKLKLRIGCLLFLFAIFLVIAIIFAFLWLGGFVQKQICSLVVEGSSIYSSIECNSYLKQEKQVEYIYKEFSSSDNSYGEDSVSNIFSDASPAVVAIGVKADQGRQDRIIGTGFIVTSNGLIVTNRHVVENSTFEYFVNLQDSDESIEVAEIFLDPINDIALVKIDKTDLPSLPLGDSDGLLQGQAVVAIGNPLGKFSGTVTSGIISGLNREVQISEGFFKSDTATYEDVIQTDAAINPGNSGGPLLNSKGEVIGMNFATVSGADNLSFAIPVNRIKSRIEELNEYGKFRIPFVGIEYRLRIVFVNGRSTVGAEVTRVLKGTPADQSGLKTADIILTFGESDLEEKSLYDLIQQSEIGQEVKLGIIRGTETLETIITIAERE